MSNRPYFKFTGDQIRQVFDENQNDLEVLKQVLAELQLRSTPKMKALRSKVEERIEVLASSSGSPKTESPRKNNSPKHELRQSQTSKPEQKSLFGDDNKPHGEAKKPLGLPPLKPRRPIVQATRRQRKSLHANFAWEKCGSLVSWTEFRLSGSLTSRMRSN